MLQNCDKHWELIYRKTECNQDSTRRINFIQENCKGETTFSSPNQLELKHIFHLKLDRLNYSNNQEKSNDLLSKIH